LDIGRSHTETRSQQRCILTAIWRPTPMSWVFSPYSQRLGWPSSASSSGPGPTSGSRHSCFALAMVCFRFGLQLTHLGSVAGSSIDTQVSPVRTDVCRIVRPNMRYSGPQLLSSWLHGAAPWATKLPAPSQARAVGPAELTVRRRCPGGSRTTGCGGKRNEDR
jgi:hypothetical protein